MLIKLSLLQETSPSTDILDLIICYKKVHLVTFSPLCLTLKDYLKCGSKGLSADGVFGVDLHYMPTEIVDQLNVYNPVLRTKLVVEQLKEKGKILESVSILLSVNSAPGGLMSISNM